MRRTKEEAAKTRQDLLDAALAEFSSRGYQAARLQDIAAAAGTTRGAIYHHFDNKAGLYRALLKDANTLGSQVVVEAIQGGGSVVEILRAILVNSIHLASQDPRFKQVLALSLFRTGIDPELADLVSQQQAEAESLTKGIAGYLDTAVSAGEIRGDIAPEVLATAFLAYQNGIFFVWLAGGERFDLEKSAAALAEVFLTGVSAQ